jgi:hypothetical protein
MHMENNYEKASRSGIAELTEDLFEMPARPTLLRSEALDRLRRLLAERKIEAGELMLSDEPVRRRSLFDAAGRRVEFPGGEAFERSYVALVDLDPAARWAHPALWAFIPAEGGETPLELRETNVPENQSGAVRLLPEGPV